MVRDSNPDGGGGSGVHGHPQSHSEVEACVGYLRPCLKTLGRKRSLVPNGQPRDPAHTSNAKGSKQVVFMNLCI